MTDEHRCISCRLVDEGPNAECVCMEPGPPCGVCGYPQWEPLTPWKSNEHWAEDGHEWEPVPVPREGENRQEEPRGSE